MQYMLKGVSQIRHLSPISWIGDKCLITGDPTAGTPTKHKKKGPESEWSALLTVHRTAEDSQALYSVSFIWHI